MRRGITKTIGGSDHALMGSSLNMNGVLDQQKISHGIGMVFVRIPAGVFTMGAPAWDVTAPYHETPAHRVRISQPFDLGVYPVTQAQWAAVLGMHPRAGLGDPTRPVEQVSWHDVQTFLQRLMTTETGVLYRLPTEAEWEYACRAGSTTAYSFGDDPDQLGAHAWYTANAKGVAHPVGQLRPNAWGLYDMHGNVGEWVHDWYDDAYYARSPACDPRGPDAGEARVHRGGSWHASAGLCGSPSRNRWHPREHVRGLGFRVLREVR